MTPPTHVVLARLEDVRALSNGYRARCPAHADTEPSLSIAQGADGRVLLKCFAGCRPEAIVHALGLRMRDLFVPDRLIDLSTSGDPLNTTGGCATKTGRRSGGRGVPPPQTDSNTRTNAETGLSLAAYAEAKALPIEFLRELGLSEATVGQTVVRMPYRDAAGEDRAVRFRRHLAGSNQFFWRRGSKVCAYGLWQLEEARRAGFIVLVEGESDTQTLWFHGIPALGLPGANAWREEWASDLGNIGTIYVVIEPDRGGEAMESWLAASAIRDRVRLVHLPNVKDPSALHLANPAAFPALWRDALEAAVPWREVVDRRRHCEAAGAERAAAGLLDDPHLLDRIAHAMTEGGYVGDSRSALLVYIALTSRLLERPMNLAIVAPSAAGKNRAIDAALPLVPSESVYVAKAASPHALIHLAGNFQHRVIVMGEADSLPDDGAAASAVRALAEDNVMTYDVVERDPRTGQFATRHVVKPGPTGLITTSTRSLSAQLGTRHLEVPLADDPAQTRRVMGAHARRVEGGQMRTPNYEPFVAVQVWLAAAGQHDVIVPFAPRLAELIPAELVRMRRDFRQLLTCIQALALLRQRQRQRTAEGRIIATIEADYRDAAMLLHPVFDCIIAEGITPAIRETVEAVGEHEELRHADLVARLRLAKSTVSYRVQRAIAGQWLVNLEPGSGRSARLIRGIPMPAARSALPTVEALRTAFECSKALGGSSNPHPPVVDVDGDSEGGPDVG